MSATATVLPIGRAERNKRDKRERLIRAARELFQAKGFEATTTREIAELADVAKGTLFFHARSKEELLVMMFQEEVGNAIDRAFAKVPDTSFLSQLMHIFNTMLRQNEHELALARIFAREMAFIRGDRHGIDAVMNRFFAALGTLIERAKDRGEIAREVDGKLLGFNLFALYYSFLVLWLGSGEPTPEGRRPTLREMLALALNGAIERDFRERAARPSASQKPRREAR
jgi:AcrR family transcriptional regulator